MTREDRKIWFNSATLVILLAGTWFTQWAILSEGQVLRERYLSEARLVAEAIDPRRAEGLSGTSSDLDRPDYHRLKEQLAAANHLNTPAVSTYLLGMDTQNQAIYLIDSHALGSASESLPGQFYEEASSTLLDAFFNQAEVFLSSVTSSRGSEASALVPIVDPVTEQLIAMLGIDHDRGQYLRRMVQSGILPCMLTLILLAALKLGQRVLERRETQENCRYRHIEAVLAAITGLVLTAAMTHGTHLTSKRDLEVNFAHLAERETFQLPRIFDSVVHLGLEGLVTFHDHSEHVTALEFADFSAHLLDRSQLTALGWVGVHRDEADHPVFRLDHLVSRDNPSLAEPFSLPESSALHAALVQTMATRLTTSLMDLDFLRDLELGSSMLVIRPSLEGNPSGQVRGFVLGVLPYDRLLPRVQRTSPSGRIDVQVHSELVLLNAEGIPESPVDNHRFTAEHADFGPKFRRPLFSFGRCFGVLAHPTPAFMEAHGTRAPWGTAVAGLFLTLVMTVNIGLISRDQRQLEALVHERTATLQESEDRFRDIAESMADWIWEVDRLGRYTFCSDHVAKALGYQPEELLGKTVYDIMQPEEVQRIDPLIQELVAERKPFPGLESWRRKKTGELVCSLSKGVPIYDSSGKYRGYRGVDTDITKRKLAENNLLEMNRDLEKATIKASKMAHQAELASAAKSEFLANMSHEIRTPLNGVIGMTELLLETRLGQEQRQFAETIQTSGETLLGIISDILDFSKIEAGKLVLEELDFDLRTEVEDMAGMMAYRVFSKDLDFICSVNPDTPRWLRGDPGRLRQVLMNLVGNATKFTQEGEIEVRVDTEKEAPDHAVVRFSIRDTGIGILEDKLSTLFQQFTQVDASTTREYGGTGLGLAISKQLAEAMGGQIGVTSEPGQGTTFWFTARLAKQEAGTTPREPGPDFQGHRILLAGPSTTTSEVLKELLASLGAEPSMAIDLATALDMAQESSSSTHPFRAVIVDTVHNDQAMVLIEEKYQDSPGLERVPVLLVCDPTDRALSSGHRGQIHTLAKPVRMNELTNLLGTALSPAGGAAKNRVAATTRATGFAGQDLRILLVEDNIVNQKVAQGMLKKFGLGAKTVANGQEAIEALSSIDYDLVFMDCQMPVMDGYAATRLIRDTTTPVLNHGVPIVAMTANAMQGDKEKCLLAGMDDYVAKPITPKALKAALARWLPINSVDST